MDKKKVSCPVQQAIIYMDDYLDGPMCGKCFPCSMGSYEVRLKLHKIASGQGEAADIAALERIATQMLDTSMCKKGKDTADYLQQFLKTNAQSLNEHCAGRCSQMECLDIIEYHIDPKKCDRCGLCQPVCRYDAIIGQVPALIYTGYVPFQIRQNKCVKCGECVSVCPTGAIEVVSGEDEEAGVPEKEDIRGGCPT